MTKKQIFSSQREANKALWSNDTPFKATVIPNKKKRYKRKEKHSKKDFGPFALIA